MKKIYLGEFLKTELIEGRKLSIRDIAEALITTETNIDDILDGKIIITPNMALKLEKKFGGLSSHFLKLQNNCLKDISEEDLHIILQLKRL